MIVVLNKNPKNNQIIDTLLKTNTELLCAEKDGYSIYRDGEIEHHMTYGTVTNDMTYKGEKLFVTHFRTSTGGERNENGLHLQRLQNRYIFAHNGVVSQINQPTKSDSYHFFDGMVSAYGEAIDESYIGMDIADFGFSGRGFLYDEKDEVMHIFSTYIMYIYALPDCLIFATFKLETEVKAYTMKEVLGMPFKQERKFEIPFLFEDSFYEEYLKFDKGVLAYKADLPFKEDRKDTWFGGYGKHKGKHKRPTYNPPVVTEGVYRYDKKTDMLVPVTKTN